jgi:LuxR family transcriptional regulator, maltose regulon positive regulatory protein
MWEPLLTEEVSGSTTRSDMATAERLLTEVATLRLQVATLHGELVQDQRRTAQREEVGRPQPASSRRLAAVLYATYFGTFTLYRGRTRLPLGRNRPVIELCRYLLAHAGQTVPRDELLELLWPEADPARAVHRLHVAISGLRRLLDPAGSTASLVRLDDESYSIPEHAIITDCNLFEQHYRRGKTHLFEKDYPAAGAAFRAALQLYVEDYLADDLYAEWTHKQRSHFVECRLNALTFLCEAAALEHDLTSLLEYARQILEVDNLRERSHRYLMRAHYSMGQRACAIRQYNACAEILGQELGVLPSQQTQRLYEAIRDDTELPGEAPLRP